MLSTSLHHRLPRSCFGGHTMFLSSGSGGEALPVPVSEYIHSQTDFELEHWTKAGSLVGLTDGPLGGELGKQREHHWKFLQTVYGEAPIREWMEWRD